MYLFFFQRGQNLYFLGYKLYSCISKEFLYKVNRKNVLLGMPACMGESCICALSLMYPGMGQEAESSVFVKKKKKSDIN